VGKNRRNPQYFKEKKLQSKIFNQLNILKKIKKIKESWKKKKVILEKRIKLEKNDKMQKKKKECTVGFVCGGTVIPSHHLDIS